MKTEHVLRVVPGLGDTIYNVAERMVFLVDDFGLEVISKFNDTDLMAKHGDTAGDIVASYFSSRE